MIYSDAELKRWWSGLGKTGQRELFLMIKEKCEPKTPFRIWISRIHYNWSMGFEISVGDLAKLRKWDHSK